MQLPEPKRALLLAGQALLALAVVWYAVRALSGEWQAAAARLTALRPGWGWIAAATVLVLLTYVMLIDAWRRIVVAAGEDLPFRTATRIWLVSNLGKYVPGKIWSIAAMSMMARQSAVSGVTAAGSSILIQLVTLSAGIGVLLVTGAGAVDRPAFAAVMGALIMLSVAAAPVILPPVFTWAARMAGWTVTVPRVPPVIVWLSAFRAVVCWIGLGVAFQLFVRGVLGSAPGAVTSYIAAFVGSYIIGYLALFAPGGAVVREGALIAAMLRLGLCGEADAFAVAVASRLWLTAVEVIPGLGLLVAGKRAPPTTV